MVKALVVDDEQAVREVVAALLERNGFETVAVDSARAGLAALGEHRFDVVVTDLRMESPLAGFDIVKAARRLTPRPAIVILTAFPVPGADWRRAGADACIVKGGNPAELPRRLKALLKSGA